MGVTLHITNALLPHPGWAVAIGKNVQEIRSGDEIEPWERTALALHVVSESLLADLELPLLLLKVLHQTLLAAAAHCILSLLEVLQHVPDFFVNGSKADSCI